MHETKPLTTTTATIAPKLGLIAIVAAVIGALSALDWSLAQTERMEMRNAAQAAYRNGLDLLARGNTGEAVDALRRAHSLERQNLEYELGLVNGLMAAGKTDEAEPLLNELLQKEPNDGSANLVTARLMRKSGRLRDAKAYYHRAIYGSWPSDAEAHQIAARRELIDFLLRKGNQQEVMAELIPLEEEAGTDVQLKRELAHLFLLAGSPNRSAELYKQLINGSAPDGEAYEGLGDAYLAGSDYHAAHAAYVHASEHKRSNTQIQSKLDLAKTLSALDPTVRQLSSAEKYQRSLRLLKAAQSSLQACLAAEPVTNKEDLQRLLAAVDEAHSSRTAAPTNEVAERVLETAQKIWREKSKICRSRTTSDEEALRIIMDKVGQ